MSIFQKVYDWIKRQKLPAWMNELLDKLLKKVIIPMAIELGEEVINFIKSEVIRQSKLNISGTEKCNNVFNATVSAFGDKQFRESVLNRGIENIVGLLKSDGYIT